MKNLVEKEHINLETTFEGAPAIPLWYTFHSFETGGGAPEMKILFRHWPHPNQGRLLSQTFLGRISKVTSLIIISILGLKLSNDSPQNLSSSSNLRESRPEGSLSVPSLEVGREIIGLQQQQDYLPGLEAIHHGRLVSPDQVGVCFFFHILFWHLTIHCFQVGELCEGAINLGMILINLENTTRLGERFSSKVIHHQANILISLLCCRLDEHLRRCLPSAQVNFSIQLSYQDRAFLVYVAMLKIDNIRINPLPQVIKWTQEPPSIWLSWQIKEASQVQETK